MSPVTLAYVVSTASASRATSRIASGVGCDARRNSAPILESTPRAGSRFGKTESVTATSVCGMLPLHRLFHVFHHGEDDGAFAGNEHVLFKTRRLPQAGMTRERLNGEIHVLFDLGWILERVGARHPHAFIERQADAVRELL